MASVSPPQPRTALLLIDIQDGFLHPTHWGPSRSNPLFESNITALLTTYRSLIQSSISTSTSTSTTSNTSSPPHKILHISHSSLHPTSPLHPSSPGFAFQPLAAPLPSEQVLVKNVNSAFIGTDLEAVLRRHFPPARQRLLYIVGLSTDHCVSTTVRMAGNLGVVGGEGNGDGDGDGDGEGRVVLIEDATAAWRKSEKEGGFEAEVVHAVHVESLREFAVVERTGEVVGLWRRWIEEGERGWG